MLHFSKDSGNLQQILDDQGIISGSQIFDTFTFDGTAGGAGQTNQMSLYVYNADTTYQYNIPVLSIVGTDAIEQKSWFTLLDDENVAGIVPTESDWTTYGINGAVGTLTLLNIGAAAASPIINPSQRKFWIRCAVPAGIATINLTGLSVRVNAIQEAV